MNIEKAYDLIQQTLNNWMQHFVKMLPNILLSAVVLVVGLYVCQWIRRLTRKLTGKISHNPALSNLLVSIIYLSSIGILIFTVLSILQLDKAVTSILAGAGIAGLAIAFAFQDIAANFISGIFISFRRPLFVGDIVKIKDYMGRVEEINLRDTVIRTFQGQMVIIPNKDVFQNPIENYTLLGKRRIDLSIGVSYGEDLERVREITLDAVKDIDGLSGEDDVTMFYQEFGDSSINFIIRLWINTPEQLVYWAVCSETIIRIKRAYDEHNIMIPFPIRTLDFGIKGGVSLDEVQIKT